MTGMNSLNKAKTFRRKMFHAKFILYVGPSSERNIREKHLFDEGPTFKTLECIS